MDDKPVITPKTKVLQLIEAYPQLEEVLIALVPVFRKPPNPLPRRLAEEDTRLSFVQVKRDDLF